MNAVEYCLLQGLKVAGPAHPALVCGQESLSYGALVARVAKYAAVLRERGVRLLYDAPRRGTSGSRVNFIHPKDVGGVLVELVEPAGL